MLARVPDAPEALARRVVAFVHRLRGVGPHEGARDRRDARLGGRAALARRDRAQPAGRRRDARRRPQVRGGHPARSRRSASGAARRGCESDRRMDVARSAGVPRSATARQVDGRQLFGERSGSGGRCGARASASTSARRSTSPARSRSSTSAIASRSGPPARRSSSAARMTSSRTTRSSTATGAAGSTRRRGRCSTTPGGARARGRRARRARSRRSRATSGSSTARTDAGCRCRATTTSRRRRATRRDCRSRRMRTRKLEALRHREFDRMTPAELRDAERLVDLLVPRLERRRTRRYELHPHGRRLAPRAMFRRNLATGGEIIELGLAPRRCTRPRPLVVICDISGSMERHSRLLLRFVQALAASSAVKTESFVFGTRLTRVTRLMRDRDRDRALAKVADSVTDWAGGTRIGESFHEFNVKWARRTLRTSGVVIVVSDGWDRGDPALVAVEAARLRRNCHRLVWLNPLAGTAGYQPLAAGMRAAFPVHRRFPRCRHGREPGAARRGAWRRSRRGRPSRRGSGGAHLAGPAGAAARERVGTRAARDGARSPGGPADHVANLAGSPSLRA